MSDDEGFMHNNSDDDDNDLFEEDDLIAFQRSKVAGAFKRVLRRGMFVVRVKVVGLAKSHVQT